MILNDSSSSVMGDSIKSDLRKLQTQKVGLLKKWAMTYVLST